MGEQGDDEHDSAIAAACYRAGVKTSEERRSGVRRDRGVGFEIWQRCRDWRRAQAERTRPSLFSLINRDVRAEWAAKDGGARPDAWPASCEEARRGCDSPCLSLSAGLGRGAVLAGVGGAVWLAG